MIGFFGHNLEELAPPDTSAQYQDPRAGSVPSPYGPGSPLIPAQRPDVFYSDPNPATAPLPTGGPPVGILQQLANGLTAGIDSHPLTLMALGAGIAQGGVGRGLDLAAAAAQAERNLQAQQVNQRPRLQRAHRRRGPARRGARRRAQSEPYARARGQVSRAAFWRKQAQEALRCPNSPTGIRTRHSGPRHIPLFSSLLETWPCQARSHAKPR